METVVGEVRWVRLGLLLWLVVVGRNPVRLKLKQIRKKCLRKAK